MRHTLGLRTILSALAVVLFLSLLSAPLSFGQDATGRSTAVKKKRVPVKPKPRPPAEPPTVMLTVITDPPDCDVYLNQEKRGTTSPEGRVYLEKIPLGHYDVEVRKEGFTAVSRTFEAGTQSPTLVFKLIADLSKDVREFETLIQAGKLMGPEKPNARDVLAGVASRFPDRSEVAQMKTTLAARLSEWVEPVVQKAGTNWRDITRDELARARDAAQTAAALNGDDKRSQLRASYLAGLVSLRDWHMTSQPFTPPGSEGPLDKGSTDMAGKADLEAARANLERAVQMDDTWGSAWFYLGTVTLLLGDAPAAESAFQKVLQIEPQSFVAQSRLGSAYYAGKKYNEAMAVYQKMIASDPRSSLGYAGLGLVRCAKGDSKNGIKDIQRAIDMDPQNPVPHFNMGLAYSQSRKDKETGRAVDELKKVIQLDPLNFHLQNRQAQQLIGEIQTRKAQPDKNKKKK